MASFDDVGAGVLEWARPGRSVSHACRPATQIVVRLRLQLIPVDGRLRSQFLDSIP